MRKLLQWLLKIFIHCLAIRVSECFSRDFEDVMKKFPFRYILILGLSLRVGQVRMYFCSSFKAPTLQRTLILLICDPHINRLQIRQDAYVASKLSFDRLATIYTLNGSKNEIIRD